MKRLLSKQYDDIVFETFKLPAEDFFKYYLNVIEENYKANSDIFQELEKAINRRIKWFIDNVNVFPPVWEVDEHDNDVLYDQINNTTIPLMPEFGINRQVGKSFFDTQLEIVKTIEDIKDFKEEVLSTENRLPTEIRQKLIPTPMSEGFDYPTIKKRWELVSSIYKNVSEYFVPEDKKDLKTEESLLTFENIFSDKDYEKYINALVEVENPVLDSEWNFIGQPRKHKGVICSWIKHLQNKGIIKRQYTRSQLAIVLNYEIKGLNLGKDGKTFDNVSKEYRDNYEKKLIKLIQ